MVHWSLFFEDSNVTQDSGRREIVSSANRAFTLEIEAAKHGLSITRRTTETSAVPELVVLVGSADGFDRLRSADPLRFEHHHEYERASRFVLQMLEESKGG